MEPESPSPYPPVPILSQLHPVPTTPSNFLKIHLNIILPSTSWPPQWPLSLRLPHQHPVHTSILPHTRYMPCPSHYIYIYKFIFALQDESSSSWECYWLPSQCRRKDARVQMEEEMNLTFCSTVSWFLIRKAQDCFSTNFSPFTALSLRIQTLRTFQCECTGLAKLSVTDNVVFVSCLFAMNTDTKHQAI